MAVFRYLVSDVDTSVPFYTQHLGFHLVESMAPAFAIVERGDCRVWLSGPPSSAARPMPDGRKPEPGGWNRIVIEVEDLEAVVSRLQAGGVVFRNNIVKGPGGRQILAQDPSGNPIEIFQAA